MTTNQTDRSFLDRVSDPADIRTAAVWATVALVAYAYYLLVVVALHFLRPDVNPVSRTISEYGVGQFGVLLTSAFIAWGLGTVALAVGLRRGVARSGRSRAGLILLVVNGVSAAIAGIYPTDLKGAPPTISGLIHVVASLVAFPCLVLALFLLARRFRHDAYWHAFYPTAWGLAWVALILFLVNFVASTTDWAGLAERVFVAIPLIWLLLAGARLRAEASQYAYSGGGAA